LICWDILRFKNIYIYPNNKFKYSTFPGGISYQLPLAPPPPKSPPPPEKPESDDEEELHEEPLELPEPNEPLIYPVLAEKNETTNQKIPKHTITPINTEIKINIELKVEAELSFDL